MAGAFEVHTRSCKFLKISAGEQTASEVGRWCEGGAAAGCAARAPDKYFHSYPSTRLTASCAAAGPNAAALSMRAGRDSMEGVHWIYRRFRQFGELRALEPTGGLAAPSPCKLTSSGRSKKISPVRIFTGPEPSGAARSARSTKSARRYTPK